MNVIRNLFNEPEEAALDYLKEYHQLIYYLNLPIQEQARAFGEVNQFPVNFIDLANHAAAVNRRADALERHLIRNGLLRQNQGLGYKKKKVIKKKPIKKRKPAKKY